jgi:hypothetical protein
MTPATRESYNEMDISQETVDAFLKWMGPIAGLVAIKLVPHARGIYFAVALFLLVYVKLPMGGRGEVDEAAVSAVCFTHRMPLRPDKWTKCGVSCRRRFSTPTTEFR